MAQERLIQSNAATSDINGLATFNLGPAELGLVWQGTLQVPQAPSGALFTATILGTFWGQWAGPTNYGPIQLWGGEKLQVTATGLKPQTPFVLTFVGVWMSSDQAIPIPPAAPISAVIVETTTPLVSGQTVSMVNGTVTLTPPSLTRRLSVVAAGFTGNPPTITRLTGVQTGNVYGNYGPGSGSGLSSNFSDGPVYFAIEPNIDSTYTLSFSGGTGTAKIFVVASVTNPLVQAILYQPIQVIGVVGGAPIPITGPVGTFDHTSQANWGVGANQTVINAPGLNKSIYIQAVTAVLGPGAGAGDVSVTLHATGGVGFARILLAAPTASQQHTFPDGGWQVPGNTAVQVDVTGQTIGLIVTYAIG